MKYWHLKRAGLAGTALLAVFALSACVGKAFLGKWEVEEVYSDRDDPNPMDPGAEFRIVRESHNSFRIEGVAGFNRFPDQWNQLEFTHRRIKREQPVSIDETFPKYTTAPKIKQGGATPASGPKEIVPKHKINAFYRELARGNRETLEGGPLEIHGDSHNLHFFLFENADREAWYEKDLAIFFCHDDHCNHNGMVHVHR